MIYCVTLNPALDNIIEVEDRLQSEHNNRIINKKIDVGGKGTHVSIALKLLGIDTICTGITGEQGYDSLTEQLEKYKVESQFILEKNEAIRNNFIITSNTNQSSYLITEKGFALNKNNIDRLYNDYLSKASYDDIIIIAGNPSSDTSTEMFTYFMEKIVNTGAKIAIDLHDKYLKVALQYPILFAKPNQYEFADFINKKINNSEDVKKYLINEDINNIEFLSVSLGRKGSIITDWNDMYEFDGLQVETINDTGSGDAYFAGMIYGLIKELSIKDIGQLATAIGAAKAQETTTSGFKMEKVNEYREKVTYRKV